MAVEALKAQAEYTKALGWTQFGLPLLVPTGEPQVGDVAYFLGSSYTKVFNVFRLDQHVIVLSRLNTYCFVDCCYVWS
jgi:hypothetical protein